MKRLVLFIVVAAIAAAAPAYYPEWVRAGVSAAMTPITIRSGDFNGDGRPDVLYRLGDHSLYFLPIDAQGKPGASVLAYTGDYIGDVAVVDVDGDQKVDLVVSDIANNTLRFVRSKGDGTFDAPVITSLDFAPSTLVAGDFNGDGRSDVAVLSYSSAILVLFRGDGAGHFAETSRVAVPTSAYTMAAGDVDGDGRIDLLVARGQPLGFDLFYGKGNGTMEAATPFSAAAGSTRFLIADLDGDGDAEILSTEFNANTLTVLVNLGSRTFAAPVVYPFESPQPYIGNPADVVVAEVTGDQYLDVVVSLTNLGLIATFPGNGNGSLGKPEFAIPMRVTNAGLQFPLRLLAADFNGDGKTDLAVSSGSSGGIGIYANAAGAVSFSVHSSYPVVSEGWSVPLSVGVLTADGHRSAYQYPAPFPVGTLKLIENGSAKATAKLQDFYATLEAKTPSVGTHTYTIDYSGDDAYRPAVSPEFTQKVVAEKSNTTLTNHTTKGEPLRYGQQLILSVEVTSPLPGDTYGQYWPYIDGVRQQYTSSTPSPFPWYVQYLEPGTHTFYAQYEGNATQPPSISNVITQVWTKGQSRIQIDYGGFQVTAGAPLKLHISLSPVDGGTPGGGWVRIYEGTQMLASAISNPGGSSGGMSMDILLPGWYTTGMHVIRAEYEGDKYFEGSVSLPQNVNVTPAPPTPPHRRTVSH